MDDPSHQSKVFMGELQTPCGCLCAAGEGAMVRAVAACRAELSRRLLGV